VVGQGVQGDLPRLFGLECRQFTLPHPV
jgi:hypothetical protein